TARERHQAAERVGGGPALKPVGMAQRQSQWVLMGVLQSGIILALLWGYLPFFDLKSAPALIQIEAHLAVPSLALLLVGCWLIPTIVLAKVSRPWGQSSARLLAIGSCALQLCYLFIDRQLFRVMRLHLNWS